MSLKAMLWALYEAPTDLDSSEFRILMLIADHVDTEGKGFYASGQTISELLHMSRRTVVRKMTSLYNKGIIKDGNNELLKEIKPGHRPRVYDLNITQKTTHNTEQNSTNTQNKNTKTRSQDTTSSDEVESEPQDVMCQNVTPQKPTTTSSSKGDVTTTKSRCDTYVTRVTGGVTPVVTQTNKPIYNNNLSNNTNFGKYKPLFFLKEKNSKITIDNTNVEPDWNTLAENYNTTTTQIREQWDKFVAYYAGTDMKLTSEVWIKRFNWWLSNTTLKTTDKPDEPSTSLDRTTGIFADKTRALLAKLGYTRQEQIELFDQVLGWFIQGKNTQQIEKAISQR